MFQLLKNPKIDFMAQKNLLLGVSGVVVAASILVLAVIGLNLGIEFTGGTELVIRYADSPDIAGVRKTISDAGIAQATVTTIGKPEENEINVRLGSSGDPEAETDRTGQVVAALRLAADGPQQSSVRDLNVIEDLPLLRLIQSGPTVDDETAAALTSQILEYRKEHALIGSHDALSGLPAMTAEALAHLRDNTRLGTVVVRSQSYIGPAIGEELKNKAGLAILGSLLGMLIYIWIRFQLQWGLAAVVALAHDTVVVLGLFALFGKEMSLPVVAAFLTLVGYSVNDTVVVFDRIRENLKKSPGKSLEQIVNRSINQTLSRTVITSVLTLFVVVALLAFGGAALNAFAFVLTAGVLVGTYSSIYVASPFLVLWKRFLDKRSDRGPAKAAGTKKVTRRPATS